LTKLACGFKIKIAQTAQGFEKNIEKEGKYMLKKYTKGFFAILAAAFLFVSVQSAAAQNMKADKKMDIVETAVAAGQFTTLAKALQAADLVNALKDKNGKLTVFAPTDAAFAKLPAGTLESLLLPENKEKLKAILLYHVVNGKVAAKDVAKLNGQSVKTLQGGTVTIDTTSGVKVNSSTVVKADVMASNGIIHVIDTVLLPAN
jgi:uncharacterized surface protein with fasciclin (FAS1) repeats